VTLIDAITRHTPLADLPELLRVDEAAIWLDCSRGVVYEMAKTGELRSVRLGRLLRIPRDELMKLAGEVRRTA
jgi:excisionase family DNA binding protein